MDKKKKTPNFFPFFLALPTLQAHSRDALRLYRSALRSSKLYSWRHPSGQRWSDVLALSLRAEFEANRKAPPMDAVFLIANGNAALLKALEVAKRERDRLAAIDATGVNER